MCMANNQNGEHKIMSVVLLDRLGSDLTIINAARVSFDKHHESIEKGDVGLIKYLAKHGHWTPFAHVQLQFRIEAPVFVARQLVKHQVGLVWNEVSRRYVDTPPTFYTPSVWRKAAENVKQGSSSEAIQHNGVAVDTYRRATLRMEAVYEELLSMGVCSEQARMVLPQSMMTSWYWTGSLVAFARVCNQRMESTAQKETTDIAKQIYDTIDAIAELRYSWRSVTKNIKENVE